VQTPQAPQQIARPSPQSPVAPAPQTPSAPQPAPQPGELAQQPEIYPVWPGQDDVVESEDLAIMAAIYPSQPGTTVQVMIDDADLTAESQIDQDHLSCRPQKINPGQHTVTVAMRRPDGSERVVSWSFYLMEERS
jgi:hypothetical protein